MPATSPTKDLKIGDVARMTGLTIDTVRFYEKERLLGTVQRNAGIRRYDQDAVRRLEFVRRALGLASRLRRSAGCSRCVCRPEPRARSSSSAPRRRCRTSARASRS